VVDEALRLREPFLQYLRQDIDERDGYASSRGRLNSLLATAAA
jgi:hypothetical protein